MYFCRKMVEETCFILQLFYFLYSLCKLQLKYIPLSLNIFFFLILNWLLRNFIDGKMRMAERMNKKKELKKRPFDESNALLNEKKKRRKILGKISSSCFSWVSFILIFKEIWTIRKLRENDFHYCHLSRFLMIFQ